MIEQLELIGQQLSDLLSHLRSGIEVTHPSHTHVVSLPTQTEKLQSFFTSQTGRQLIDVVLRLGLVGIFSYFTLKWARNAMDPTREQKKAAKDAAQKLLKMLGISDSIPLSEYEMLIASQLINTGSSGVDWEDIGGYDHLIQEVQDKIIFPLKLRYTNSLLSPPKGVLLYGPPGCGKTLFAKAIAKAAGARFINLQVSSLTDKWYGESQKITDAVFSLAKKLEPTIIFIDEIDSFLRSRQANDHEATAMMKAAFMSLWDGFTSDHTCHVVVMGATNRPQDVDAAILRRMPTRFHVQMPTAKQRQSILRVIMRDEQFAPDVDLMQLAEACKEMSGSDLKELCRMAAVARLKRLISAGHPLNDPQCQPLSQADLIEAAAKVHSSKIPNRHDLEALFSQFGGIGDNHRPSEEHLD